MSARGVYSFWALWVEQHGGECGGAGCQVPREHSSAGRARRDAGLWCFVQGRKLIGSGEALGHYIGHSAIQMKWIVFIEC